MNTKSTINPYPWRRFYPKGVPDEINPDAYTSLAALLEEGCRRFTDRPAYACMGKQITFGELDKLSDQFASFLQNELKLQKGDRIAIQMPNMPAVSCGYVWCTQGRVGGSQYEPAVYTPRNAASVQRLRGKSRCHPQQLCQQSGKDSGSDRYTACCRYAAWRFARFSQKAACQCCCQVCQEISSCL